MSFEYPVLKATFLAGADLSTCQYMPVVMTSSGSLALFGSTVAGFAERGPLGWLQDKTTAAGKEATVMLLGVTKAIVGGASGLEMAILPGAWLASTGFGVLPSSSGASNRIVGMALEACSTFSATATPPVISILILNSGAYST